MRTPGWWRGAFLDDPLLYACATAGASAEEVIAIQYKWNRRQRRIIEHYVAYVPGTVVARILEEVNEATR